MDWNRQPRRTSVAAQHVRVGQVAVMRDREAAELEIGIERLHVAQDRVAGGGVAVVADRAAAGQRGDHPARRRNCRRPGPGRDASGSALPSKRDDAGRLLAAMLQRVQAERGHARPRPARSRRRRRRIPRGACRRRGGESAVMRSHSPDLAQAAADSPALRGRLQQRRRGRLAARRAADRAAAGIPAEAVHHPAARLDRRRQAMRACSTGSGQRSTGTTIPAAI